MIPLVLNNKSYHETSHDTSSLHFKSLLFLTNFSTSVMSECTVWPCYATFNYRFLSCTLKGTKGGGVHASYLDAQEFSSDFALRKENAFSNNVLKSLSGTDKLQNILFFTGNADMGKFVGAFGKLMSNSLKN